MKYLASPYSHPQSMIQQVRYELALEALTNLTRAGLCIYSPIVHYHNVYLSDNITIRPDFEFFRKINFEMLGYADEILVLKIQGWGESKGVTGERAEAARLGIPERFLEREEWL